MLNLLDIWWVSKGLFTWMGWDPEYQQLHVFLTFWAQMIKSIFYIQLSYLHRWASVISHIISFLCWLFESMCVKISSITLDLWLFPILNISYNLTPKTVTLISLSFTYISLQWMIKQQFREGGIYWPHKISEWNIWGHCAWRDRKMKNKRMDGLWGQRFTFKSHLYLYWKYDLE